MSNTIQFRSDSKTPATEVLRLSQDGIWANPDIPVDDAAKLVLAAIDDNIRMVVNAAIEAEREACAAQVDENAMGCENPIYRSLLQSNAAALRERGQA